MTSPGVGNNHWSIGISSFGDALMGLRDLGPLSAGCIGVAGCSGDSFLSFLGGGVREVRLPLSGSWYRLCGNLGSVHCGSSGAGTGGGGPMG